MTAWTQEQALTLIRSLAEKLKPVYCVGLTGSVLVKGQSRSDLDIIVYPASSAAPDYGFVVGRLLEAGLVQRHGRDVVTAKWRRKGSTDSKHVEVWEYEGKKVDIFFLS